jgi:periplasmic divalent cation tolerance protein
MRSRLKADRVGQESATGFITVYMTASSAEEAGNIARALVQNRLVACANVLEGVTSYFWWDGEVQGDNEVVIIAKSRSELFVDIETCVKALHSYDCPCIVAWPIETGSADYLAWIEAETRPLDD